MILQVCLNYLTPLDSKAITDRKVVINQLWTDLKDLTDARSLALAGAKEIHTFNRDAGDAKERVQVCTVYIISKIHSYVWPVPFFRSVIVTVYRAPNGKI